MSNVARFNYFDHLTRCALVVFFALFSVIPVFLMQWYYSITFYISAYILTVFFIRPKWGTYSLIFLVPFTTFSFYFLIRAKWNFIIGQRYIDMVPLFAPAVLFTFLGFAFRKLIRVEQGTSGNLIVTPIFIVFLYSGLTMIWSDFSGHNVFQFLTFAMNVGIFVLIISYVKEEEDLKCAVWFWVLSALLQALSSLLFFFLSRYYFEQKIFVDYAYGMNIMGGYLQPSGKPLVDSGFMDHHELALMMNLAIAVTFGLFLTKLEKFKKAFLVVSMFIFILVTCRTESRGGIGSLFLMVFFIPLVFNVTRRYFIRLSFVFGIGLTVLYILQAVVVGKITNTDMTPRLIFLGSKMVKSQNLVDPGLKNKDTGRMRLWKKCFKKYKEYWIQGFGVGNLKKFIHAPHAHNVFLSFLFDYGLLGLVSVMYIVGTIVKRFIVLLQNQSSYLQIMSVAFGTGLIAIGFHGQFDFEYNTTLLWLYLGLTVSSFRVAYQEILRSNPEEGSKKL